MVHLAEFFRSWRRRATSAVNGGHNQWDRGSAATIAAVMFGGGAFIGVATVVVDVGQVYIEREELQSGADSAAEAIARVCAVTPSSCSSQATLAANLANSNAKDGNTLVTAICGTGQGLPACPTPRGNLTDCMGTRPTLLPYVEVHVVSKSADGSTGLTTTFADVLAGRNAGTTKQTIGACTRAAWGAATSGTSGLSATISRCEFGLATNYGTHLYNGVGSPASYETVLTFHDPHSDHDCGSGPSGWDGPGSFGGLVNDPPGSCHVTISAGGTYTGTTGRGKGLEDCETALSTARSTRKPIQIPVYKDYSKPTYTLDGMAGFVVTGYSIKKIGSGVASNLTGIDCGSSSVDGICGYFTSQLISPGTPAAGGTDYGVKVVGIIG